MIKLFDTEFNGISKFPNGEKKVTTLSKHNKRQSVTWKWETDADLIELLLFKKHNPDINTLTIAYMPYSRMDRDGQGGTCCSLRYIGEFIKDMGWESIEVLEPHSEATLAFLGDTAVSFNVFDEFAQEYPDLFTPDRILMFPDAGAQKRYSADSRLSKYEYAVGLKKRDFETGKIKSYTLVNGELCTDKRVLVVDDLSSFGGTFIHAAEEISKFNPAQIDLLVTHAENSINAGELYRSSYKNIYTTNSLLTEYTSGGPNWGGKLKVLELF